MSESQNSKPAPEGVLNPEEPLLPTTETESSGAVVATTEGGDEDPEPVSDQTYPEEKQEEPSEKQDRITEKKIEALGPQKKMDDRFSDSEYRQFADNSEKVGNISDPPPRYKVKTTDPEKQARSQARAEARRTRRTIRLQQQAEQQQHYKISTAGDSSEESSVDENFEVDSLAESEVENLTWRGRMQHVLHHHWFHLVIAILVSLDAVIVVFELLIDVGAFNNVLCEGTNFQEQAEVCHYTNRNECFPLAKMILEGVNISASPSDTGRNSELCRCGFRQGQRVCINFSDNTGVNPALVLHVLSILILSTFLVEILLKIIAFRLKYFTHKFEVFDGTIVVISWMLDVASISQEEAFEAASLIIVLRLWRVIRIVNGAVITSKSQSDQDLEKSRNEARKIIHALHKAQDRMDELEDENIKLKRKHKH